MATAPIFVGTANGVAMASGGGARATPYRSGTPTGTEVVTIFTAGASGARIEGIMFHARETTTTGWIGIWEHDGSAFHLIGEVSVTIVAPSTTTGNTIAWNGTWIPPLGPFILTNGKTIKITTSKAEVFTCRVVGGDF